MEQCYNCAVRKVTTNMMLNKCEQCQKVYCAQHKMAESTICENCMNIKKSELEPLFKQIADHNSNVTQFCTGRLKQNLSAIDQSKGEIEKSNTSKLFEQKKHCSNSSSYSDETPSVGSFSNSSSSSKQLKQFRSSNDKK